MPGWDVTGWGGPWALRGGSDHRSSALRSGAAEPHPVPKSQILRGQPQNTGPPEWPQVYGELSVGLDYCFPVLNRLSFRRERDLFGVEPEEKIKTKGRS